MCGRYSWISGARSWNVRLGLDGDGFPRGLKPRYNAAPSQRLPIVTNSAPKRVTLGRWGYVPPWAKGKSGKAERGLTIINARAETVAERPVFREAFAQRRCLVLADGFFEWQVGEGGKVPYRIMLKGGEPFALAGIWEGARGAPGFAIITVPANPLVEKIHDRMPAILSENEERAWLEDWLSVTEARRMLRPYEADAMEAYPVSTMVNMPANDTPTVLRKVA